MNIYVGNLSYGITEEDLRALFAEFGDVSSAKLIIDRETNRSKGFGFVEMSSNDAANRGQHGQGTEQSVPGQDHGQSGGSVQTNPMHGRPAQEAPEFPAAIHLPAPH